MTIWRVQNPHIPTENINMTEARVAMSTCVPPRPSQTANLHVQETYSLLPHVPSSLTIFKSLSPYSRPHFFQGVLPFVLITPFDVQQLTFFHHLQNANFSLCASGDSTCRCGSIFKWEVYFNRYILNSRNVFQR